jgi:hypothetical protein
MHLSDGHEDLIFPLGNGNMIFSLEKLMSIGILSFNQVELRQSN